MATISVRALDANHDPMYGNGQQNFLTDLAAVQQIIDTRLLLFEGEWWADLNDGLPMFQQIAGKNPQAASLLIQARILGTPYVTSIDTISTSYVNRAFKFSCQAYTPFGTITVNFQPGNSAVLPVTS